MMRLCTYVKHPSKLRVSQPNRCNISNGSWFVSIKLTSNAILFNLLCMTFSNQRFIRKNPSSVNLIIFIDFLCSSTSPFQIFCFAPFLLTTKCDATPSHSTLDSPVRHLTTIPCIQRKLRVFYDLVCSIQWLANYTQKYTLLNIHETTNHSYSLHQHLPKT